MPATLQSLFDSARRLQRKQHIWMSDTGIKGNESLTTITPYKGMKIVAFSFTVPGLTQYTITRTNRKIGPIPHHEIIAFQDCKFLDKEPSESEKKDYFRIDYNGDVYWVEKIDVARQKVVVRCDCFTGDTSIMLADGSTKTLEELEGLTDFEVISYNEENNKFEIALATKCEKKSDNSEILQITLDNNQVIKVTPDHLFLTKNNGWVQAQDLSIGQSLKALYGYSEDDKLYQSNDNKNEGYSDREWVRIRKNNSSEDYYVYIYLDPRKPGEFNYGNISFGYEPIYVGKGVRNRCRQHLTNRLIEDSYFYRKLNKIISEGYEPIIIKQSAGLTESLAFEYEKELISKIGVHFDNSGPLTNNTYGGEGSSGLIQSEKVKDRMRNNNPMRNSATLEKQKKTAQEREVYKKISEGMKNNNPMFNEDTINKCISTRRELGQYSHDKMSKMASARTEETFKQIIKTREANNPDCYKKMVEGNKKWRAEAIANGTYHAFTDEFKNKVSEASKARWNNTKFREEMLTNLAKSRNNPEVQEKIHKAKILKGMIEVIKTYGEFIPEHYKTVGGRMRLSTVKERGWYEELISLAKEQAFYNHKIMKIERIENAPTYCITVKTLGNFVVSTPDNDSTLFSGVVVKNCKDFIMSWAYEDFRTGNLWGPPPKPYIRKTPAPPMGRPYRNPNHYPGYCKHIYYLWRNFFLRTARGIYTK